MKKIVVITTGGTIAMTKQNKKGVMPSLVVEDLVRGVSELNAAGEISVYSWKNVPSSHLELNDIVELAQLIKDLQGKGFDGVVITHGTDTMEESAYLLDLILNIEMGIVLTGAQRNSSMPGNDGPANLLDAVVTAAHPKAAQEGVLVVFNGEVHNARDVIKTHTSSLDTFKSEFGPIASLLNMQVQWYRSQLIKEHYPISNIQKRVEVVRCFMGNDSFLIDLALQAKIDGLVIESLGAGHVPIKMMTGIRKALGFGIPVVLSTRCYAGRLFKNVYGFIGSEKDLRKSGVIWGDALPGSKARIKLLVLLSAGYDLSQIRHEFEHNYYQ